VLMVVAIVLSLVATTEEIERFERSYETSGLLNLQDEKQFLENRSAIESFIRITGDEVLNVRITNDGQSAYISTRSLELSYIPDAIELSDTAQYDCTIIASSGKPYLLLSIPAALCSLGGLALLFATGAVVLREKKN